MFIINKYNYNLIIFIQLKECKKKYFQIHPKPFYHIITSQFNLT